MTKMGRMIEFACDGCDGSYEEHELEMPPHLCGTCRGTGGTFADSSEVLAAERARFKREREQTDALVAAFGPLLDFLDDLPEMPKLTALVQVLSAPLEVIAAAREEGKTGTPATSHGRKE
jgi:hypothetical protein